MSEETILRYCSPTLAGIKTGSLFADSFGSCRELTENICICNRIFVKKGLRMLPLQYRNKRALIYIFRVSSLGKDLNDAAASRLLAERGYTSGSPGRCIIRLMDRIENEDEFPHEIGLFLGYPPEDVLGFIENRANGYKCVGSWKVYGNEEEAKKLFEKYRKCTRVYRSCYAEGRSLEKLTVAG